MKKVTYLLCSLLAFTPSLSAALIWSEDFDDNNWDGTLNMESGSGIASPQGCAGTISFSTVTSPTRLGSRSARTVLKKCQGRAEFREKSRNYPAAGDERFYGFSLYPAANYDTGPITLVMQGAQWYPEIPNWAQGAWHRIEIDGGRWYYIYKYSDNGATGSSGIRENRIDLGPVARGQWTDFVIQARWSFNNNGFIKVWIRPPGGSYTVKHERTGWVLVNVPQVPYLKLGQYRSAPNWPGVNSEEFLYIDEIKVGTTYNDVAIGSGGSGAFPNPSAWYNLRNTAHGTRYLRAGNSGEGWNVNTSTGTASWERWRFVDAGGGFFYVRNYSHGGNRNLQALNTTANWNVATTTNTGSWEKWSLVPAGGNYIIRNSDHGGGRHLRAFSSAGGFNVDTGQNSGTWETWSIIQN